MKLEDQILSSISDAFAKIGAGVTNAVLENGAVNIIREHEGIQYRTHMTFSPYLTALHNFKGYIHVPAISNHLTPYLERVNLLEQSIVQNDYGKEKWKELMEGLRAFPLKKEADIPPFTEALVQHYQEHIIPFFQEYPTLEAINEKILNGVSQEEYNDYIPNPKNFKVLIMMKLCQNPKYEGFKAWALTTYEKAAWKNPKRYGAQFETLKKLVHHLDTAPELNR